MGPQMTLNKAKLISIIATVVGLVALSIVVTNRPRKQPAAVRTFPVDANDRRLWPMQNSWIWRISGRESSDSRKTLEITCRVVHEPLTDNNRMPDVRARHISKSPCDREFTLGGLAELDPTEEAIVTAQVINLEDIGIRDNKHPLHLRLQLDVKGGSSGNAREIEGRRFAGYSVHGEPKWIDGELHLLTFYTLTDTQAMIHDIVLVETQ